MKSYETKLILASLMAIVLTASGCATNGVQNGNEVNPAVTEKVRSESGSNKSDVLWKTVFQDDLKFEFLKSGFINEKVGIASAFSGENYFTSDGGKNWILSKNKSNNTNGFDMVKDNIVWYGDDFGDVGVSKDMGKTWNFGKGVFIVRVNCINAIDSSTALITEHGKAALTTDGGKTLRDIKLPEKMNQIAAGCISSKSEGFLLDFDGKLYHSNDNFKTWSSIKIKDNSGPLQIRFEAGTSSSTAYMRCMGANNLIIAYCGSDSGVYVMRSSDGGKSWAKETVTNDYAYNVYVSPDGNFITYNSGVSKVSLLKYVMG